MHPKAKHFKLGGNGKRFKVNYMGVLMIYTTMTRNKVMRLVFAKGWIVTKRLMAALCDDRKFPYFEIANCKTHLDGEGYEP